MPRPPRLDPPPFLTSLNSQGSSQLARNDVIFRQDRTPASSEAVALKAAFAVKIHLQHLVLQDPEDHMLLRFLLALEQNVWARAHLVPRCVV
ncbi:hypothetical protein ACHHYP_20817 [Achlya hypogyna]|uniref:Uncharacterized protein n=1 Tax=Achlya hypogyna TaxID=1202772 RepID=A0A1V9Y7P6_ACHHY|nr:hypothetical protein ACHHYP_20817 [Achlya hypogyna]